MYVQSTSCCAKHNWRPHTPKLYPRRYRQDEILKQMRSHQPDIKTDMIDSATPYIVESAVLYNLLQQNKCREWIDLDDALQGLANVATILIRRFQGKLSKPNKPYKLLYLFHCCIALLHTDCTVCPAALPARNQPDKQYTR